MFQFIKKKGKKSVVQGKHGKRMQRKLIKKMKAEYRLESNVYVRLRREENKYGKDIIGKGKEQSNLFYRFLMET